MVPTARRTTVTLSALLVALVPVAVTLAAPAGSAPAEATPCVVTYSSTVNDDIQVGAADTSVPLVVPVDGLVADVDLMVDISHPTVGDVSVVLHRDTGLWRTVTDGNGGTGDDYDHTVFDDEAAVPISDGTAPFAGTYAPQESIDVWDGEGAAGTWYLLVKEANLTSGDLFRSWALTFTLTTCDLDEDGVEDHGDNCLDQANASQRDTDTDGAGDACDSDDDGDGVADGQDACPRLSAGAANGCPTVDRDLTVRYVGSAEVFKGRLTADDPACDAGQTVFVWRVRPGDDQRVGRDVTDGEGRYAADVDRRSGTYYTLAPAVVEPLAGTCRKATSDRVTLR